MTKSYISLNSLHLTTTIDVDGIPTVIAFKGGRLVPNRVNGRFVTSSEILQKAIENDVGFNKDFALIVNPPEKDASFFESDQNKYIKIEGIKNKQMAIEWVATNLDAELPKKMNQHAIKQYVNSYGYDFCDWRNV
ncbi:MAG: hypothetical protein R3Y51_06050 [Rikenellaceae bacterium]